MTLLDLLPTPLAHYRAYLGLFSFGLKWGLIRYLTILLPAFALVYWCRTRSGWRTPFQREQRRPGQWRRETVFNLSTLLIGGLLGPLFVAIGISDHSRFYAHVSDYGWPYFFASFAIMLAIRETLAYWTHRLMHHRRLFRYLHRGHHLSIHTSPMTGYSVQPLESLFDAVLPTAVILLLVPVHPYAFGAFWWIDTLWVVLGHTGIEIFPASIHQHWLGRWLNTPTGHTLHHTEPRYNFGIYLLFWDRVCGTLDPAYDRELARNARPPAALGAARAVDSEAA